MSSFSPLPQRVTSCSLVLVMLAAGGCAVAPSKTVKGAGTGAATGAVVGGLVGGANGNSTQGLLAGGAAGAIIGGIVGLTQEMKEHKEQDRLAQERAYQQELAKRRAADAKAKAEMEEELAIAQGFRISDLELNDAQKKVADASARLAKLRDERNAALSKKKALDDAQEKLLATEAEVARMEEELARLKGDSTSIQTQAQPPAADADKAPKS